MARTAEQLKACWVHPGILPAADAERLLGKAIEREYCLTDLLRRPGIGYDAVVQAGLIARPAGAASTPVSRETLVAELGEVLATAVVEQVEIASKYAGYIGKQIEDVGRAAHFEHLKLPADLDYAAVKALSFEVRQTLARYRPETLGQASRLSGVTPAAISLLLVHLKKGRAKGFTTAEVAAGMPDAGGIARTAA